MINIFTQKKLARHRAICFFSLEFHTRSERHGLGTVKHRAAVCVPPFALREVDPRYGASLLMTWRIFRSCNRAVGGGDGYECPGFGWRGRGDGSPNPVLEVCVHILFCHKIAQFD